MMICSYLLIRGGYQDLTYIMFDHMRTVTADIVLKVNKLDG
jgi:hypothetical protein